MGGSRRAFGMVPAAGVAFLAALATCCASADDLGWARENALRGRYTDAIRLYRKAIGEGRGDFDAELELGRLLVITGRYADALSLAEKAAKKQPDASDAQCFLGEARNELGDYRGAAAALEEALRLDARNMRARWGLVQVLRTTGKRREAYRLAGWFFNYYAENDVTDSRELMYVALAAQDDDPKEAFRLLGLAIRKNPANEEAYLARGFLAIERYSFASAAKAFKQLLARNPHRPLAHVGQARVRMAAGKNEEAEKICREALKVNPNLVPAMNLMATLLLTDENYDGTPEQIARALAVNPKDLDTLGMQAAFAHISGDVKKRDAAISGFRSINPTSPDIYLAIARAAERKRDMPDAVKWGQKAIELAPGDWQGHFVVGMNLLRMGREREGYGILEKAYGKNKFNVWARNMLVCLDKDFRKGEYESFTTDHFVIKLHKSESKVLSPYIVSGLEKMYGELTAKYKFRPRGTQEGGRILVSFFPEHADFSARTVGLPGLSALGACMGQLVTMPSPKVGVERGPGGMFNWMRVLEHEFTHVITLQMTRYRIPRWFTEGISVWEEADPQLKWDLLLKSALEHGRLLPIKKINRGFTRPSYPAEVAVCYYHASLIIGYFIETYGMDSLVEMCLLMQKGLKAPEAIEKVTGKTLDEIDAVTMDHVKHFVKAIRAPVPMAPPDVAKLAARVSADPKDAASRAGLASACLSQGKAEEARRLAREALAIDRKVARAHNILGYVALRIDKKNPEAEKHFRAAAEVDPDDYYSRFALGYILTQTGRSAEAPPYFERAIEIYPRNSTPRNLARKNPYHLLGGLYEDRKMPAKAIDVYRRAVAIDHTDYRSAKRLGMLLAASGDPAGALAAFERCFEINPFEAETHLAAGDAAGKLGRAAVAVREYRVAAALDGRSFKAAMGLARSLAASGDRAGALAAAQKAFEIEPDSAEARRLIESLK